MKPGLAANFLQEKLDSGKRGISFLGLSIDEGLLVWAAPLITLVLLLFFFLHLYHLNGGPRPSRDLLSSFPWFGLFKDFLSRTLTFLSVVALPTLADTTVLLRSGHFPERSTVIGSIFSCGTLVCGLLALREVKKLRPRDL